jgi:hypothetical protein
MDTANHRRDTARLKVGAGGEQRTIDTEQFFGAFRLATQQLPAEMHLRVQLE